MKYKIYQTDFYIFQFDLMLSEDGSGRGAALVAAVAFRDELPSMKNGVVKY